MNKLKLLFEKEIEITYIQDEQIISMGKIKQPTLKKILKYGGEESFQYAIYPFIFTKEFLVNKLNLKIDLSDLEKITLLELFFYLGSDTYDLTNEKKQYFQMLLWGLQFFYDTKNIKFLQEDIGFLIDDKYVINKNNFDILCAYIRKIVYQKEVELEKVPNFTSDRQKDIYNKIMAGRKRNAEENAIGLIDMINLIMITNNLLDYESFLNKTYLQIIHSYKLANIKITNKAVQIIPTVQIMPKDDKTHIWMLENLKSLNYDENKKKD